MTMTIARHVVHHARVGFRQRNLRMPREQDVTGATGVRYGLFVIAVISKRRFRFLELLRGFPL